MRVLLVENDAELSETLASGLRRQRMTVDTALDGQQALARAATGTYEVVVLARDLPGIGGDGVCRRLAADGCTSRILMLTTGNGDQNVPAGFGLAADDLTKPYSFADLVGRIRGLDQLSQAKPAVLLRGDLRLDPARRLAIRGGRRLPLGPKEFDVLELLLAAGGAVVSADELLAHVWAGGAKTQRTTVKVTISRLRAKLGEPPLIETVAGYGYRV
jgi:DNA-binding response OmpR family regulator